MSAYIKDFVLSFRDRYEAFHIHIALLNVSFQSGSHMLAVLGEILLK